MHSILGISPRKTISIVFLLATIILSLILSGIPLLISTHIAKIPEIKVLPSTIGARENMSGMVPLSKPAEKIIPNAQIITNNVREIPRNTVKSSNTQSTKVYDQVFGLMEPNERFGIVHDF